MTMPTISPTDPAVQHVAKALDRHEPSPSFLFCSCSPVDDETGASEMLPVYWDTHIAQVAVEAYTEYLRSLP